MFSSYISIFLMVFLVGIVISNVVKLVFFVKNTRQGKEYEKFINEKMKSLSLELQSRAGDLQESLDIINKEYDGMMALSKEQEEPANFSKKGTLNDKIRQNWEAKQQHKKSPPIKGDGSNN